MDDDAQGSVKPAWVAPAIVLAVVIGLVVLGSKKKEATENPLVDAVVLTTVVFAMAWVLRKVFIWLDAPGAATFFGAPVQPHPDHATTTDVTEAYA